MKLFKWFLIGNRCEWIGLVGIFLYQFAFASLINIKPFNYIFNLLLIILCSAPILKFLLNGGYKHIRALVFITPFLLLLILFLTSDSSNGVLSFQPFVLLFMLLSSYSICFENNKMFSYVIMAIALSNTLGLITDVALNFSLCLREKIIVSAPYLNLDSFAAIARSNICLTVLLLIFFSNTNHFKKIKYSLSFAVIIINSILLFFSFRIGSIVLLFIILLFTCIIL